jgi:FkbM family methyltransferase
MYKELKNSKIFIYGAGKGGIKTLEHLKRNGIIPEGFLDDYKTGNEKGIKILKPDELKKYLDDREEINVFIGTTIPERLIHFINKLRNIGIDSNNIWISFFIPAYPSTYNMDPPEDMSNYLDIFENCLYKEWLESCFSNFAKKEVFLPLTKGTCIEKKFRFLMPPEKIYSFKDKGIYIDVEEGDIVLDCGAGCSEETTLNAIYFAKKAGKIGKVFSFEANPRVYKKLLQDVKEYSNILPLNLALWKENGKVHIKDEYGGSSHITDEISNETHLIKAVTIDNFAKENNLHSVDFIKMDIEGAELAALEGAKNTIKEFKPKLAICIYHKPSDFYEIPQFIKELNPNYRLFVLNNEPYWWGGTKVFAIDGNKL